jgi:hypothetical protein
MMARLFCLAIALCLVVPLPAAAQSAIVIADLRAEVDFPNAITFHAHIEAPGPLQSVVLEYGVDRQTCGTVVAKAFPAVPTTTPADISWTWKMLRSGSEPPGATVWYRWRVTDAAGQEQVSATERVTWLDDDHPWRSVSSEKLVLHWYQGSQSFADDLLAAADTALADLATSTGVATSEPIHLYIYGSTNDMREAILYEPGWTGGLAFPDYNSVIIGIGPSDLEWGRSTEAHELTHVLVGHLTFSCLGSVPTWLNEGIAVYAEGGLSAAAEKALQTAIADDQLITVRSLNGQFAEHPGKADLSYAQSYSLVHFLIGAYGNEKLLGLFAALRDGHTIEQGLQSVYAFGLDELETRWRAEIGAAPRSIAAATPTAPPTAVPTYQPLAGVSGGVVAAVPAASGSATSLFWLLPAGIGGLGATILAAGLFLKLRRNA